MKKILCAVFLLSSSYCIWGQPNNTEARVKYNNPEATVDLGVGLWGIPIPLDYDKDGKMDLLVSCPDTPYKGLYFFRNISSGGQMLFDKPVLVGEGLNDLRASYVNGQIHVIRRGTEYKDFPNKLLSQPQEIKVDADPNNELKRMRTNIWNYVDYDGDGDQDILIGIDSWEDYGWDNAWNAKGEWTKGPLHGYVYWIENKKGEYVNRGKVLAGDKPIDTYGAPFPSMYDFDGDGDLDIICGEFIDKLTWFENIGSRKKPKFAEGRYLQDENGDTIKLFLEMITPVGVDFNGDGHIDLIVGDEDGRVAFIENTGKVRETKIGNRKSKMPIFKAPVYLKQKADDLKFGALSTPVSVDWDGDGDEDIVAGNSAGNICLIENLSGGVSSKWAKPRIFQVDGEDLRIMAGKNGSIQGPCEAKWGYTCLSVADWDGDGLKDIIVNTIWGEILWYKNTGKYMQLEGPFKMNVRWDGAAPKPQWTWWTPAPNALVTQWRTTPVAIDWNNDKLMDLVVLDHEGYLTYFERAKDSNGELYLKPGKRIFYGEDASGYDSKNAVKNNQPGPLQLNTGTAGSSGRRKICFVDWDKDGDLDLMVNSENTCWFENVRQSGDTVWYRNRGNVSSYKLAGHSTSPTPADWDNDGICDLLVGAEDGHFYLLKNKVAVKPDALAHRDFVFGDDRPFKECHASTLIHLNDGNFLVSWFGGTRESHDDVGIWLSKGKPGNWSKPRQVAKIRNDAHWNPVLFQDAKGKIYLYFKVAKKIPVWETWVITSTDGGTTWSKAVEMVKGDKGGRGPVRNKPIMLSNGVWLAGASHEDYQGDKEWNVFVDRSEDNGKTWKATPHIDLDRSRFKGRGVIQPTLWESTPANVHMLVRSTDGKIYRSDSKDYGKTWCTLYSTDMPNNNSGIDLVKLPNGALALVYNPVSGNWASRASLNLAVSYDNGKTWPKKIVLEGGNNPGEYSYPAIIAYGDKVALIYTWKRERIAFWEFSDESLKP